MIRFLLPKSRVDSWREWLEKNGVWAVVGILAVVSVAMFIMYWQNGLGLAYNDARSHLDIGRRVVEGLKPGIAQLGSVWLPLPHLLMTVSIWNDFMWHSGLAGALWSMVGFVASGVVVYKILQLLNIGLFARFAGVALFAANLNILYLQSTAMTELLLIATMMAGSYYLIKWFQKDDILDLIKAGFWIMLSTLVRYDGWFLLFMAAVLVLAYIIKRKGWRTAEGTVILFCTLAGFGVALWFLWNLIIFKDAFYFAFGPYSAHAQQDQLEQAGVLITKFNWIESFRVYFYAFAYNTGALMLVLGTIGAIMLWTDKKIKGALRYATLILTAPFLFNVLALYLGHSVLFIQGLSGDTWFNVRYGAMMVAPVAIFIAYLINRFSMIRPAFVGALLFVALFSFTSSDAVTIDDARVGSSQKNVSEVSGWLQANAKNEKGFILISAASHDAIIFSSNLPMSRFIHEGTGAYWESATVNPDRWARWIVMRTYSDDDSTYRLIKNTPGFARYEIVESYPFADIYRLKDEFIPDLITDPVYPNQR